MASVDKDEIEKCLTVAKEAFRNGDRGKSERFLQKAQRMGYDSSVTLEELNAGETQSEAKASASVPSSRPSPSAGSGSPRRKTSGKYTPDQMSLVQRILRTKDYYELLEVTKDATEEDLKKAYKKMAVKLHPDKNQAPGAEEAFKKLAKAFQCLNDAQNRAAYDQYGDEERIPRNQRHGHYHEEYMTPEDLFNNLFFGGGGIRRHEGGNNRQQHHHQHHGEPQ